MGIEFINLNIQQLCHRGRVLSRPIIKYGLGVSQFKGTPQLILLIWKFYKWSKTFSLIIVSSFLTPQVYIFG